MMRVNNIIFCLKASNLEGEGPSATTILAALNPEYVPGLFTFSVIVSILDIDTSKKQRFIAEFIDPSGNTVVKIDDELPIIEDDSNLPKEYKGVNIAMDWNNVDLKQSGEYKIKIYADGVFLDEKNIFVKGKNE